MTASGRDLRLAEVLVEFARTLGTDFSIQKILDHLVQRIVDVLPITGAGVMLMGESDELHFVAASNEMVMRIESLQNELREGPCLEAYRSGEAVAITDMRSDTRFQRFSPRAWDAGLAAVFTFPLRLDSSRLGALDLYRDEPGALTEEDLAAAQVLADVAAAYLFNAQARIDSSATVARLHHRSLHDPLTGLPNRILLEELLDQAVARARRSHRIAAVLFADLDRFKTVNDSFGHHVGDELLIAVAARLSQVLRPGDTLARLAGDEFVVLCEDLPDKQLAESVAERITAALSEPFELESHRLLMTASVGIAFSGPGQDIPAELLRDADFAMYQAKNNGGAQHQILDPSARLAADRRERLVRQLSAAFDDKQFQLAYQPIVELDSGRLIGVEALLRLQHEGRSWVTPDTIIPSAERTGLIQPLGEWVLRQACYDYARWSSRSGGEPKRVAVNVSAAQVMGPAFANSVQHVLHDTGIRPDAVCLEVTESVLLADTPRALAVLREIKELGVQLSLDDFGTGYSSMNYLRKFPFDSVKIDRSFVADLHTDQVSRAIVGAMVGLSHLLDLSVVAEGIETAQELDQVVELGADHGQGFLLSEPLALPQLQDLMRS